MTEEITTRSWGSRLKEALIGILVGLAFIIGAIALIFWNEQHSLHTAQSLAQAEKLLVSVPNAPINHQNNLKVVYLNGLATTKNTLSDPMFDISVTAIALFRNVEMYQWKETVETKKESQIGGSEKEIKTYSYNKIWSEKLIDSSNFKTPKEHQNPSAMPIHSKKQYADNVTLGDFSLPDALIYQIDQSKPINLTNVNKEPIPHELNKPTQIIDNVIYVGQDPSHPLPGDLKINFSAVYPQDVSIIAQQTGNTLQAFLAPAGKTILLLSSGIQSSAQMMALAQSKNTLMTWILRLVSFLMLMGGFALILKPLVVLADVLPFFGSLVGFGTGFIAALLGLSLWIIFTATAWFATRPLWSIGLIIILIISAYLVIKKRKPKVPFVEK